MNRTTLFVRGSAIFGTLCLIASVALNKHRVHAMEVQEVKPYVFAELPHGRIYKTVHEGCELYIVESDIPTVANQPGLAFHHYVLAAGRGCQ